MSEQRGKITKEEAIRIYESKEYESWDDRQKVAMMLYGRRLCMPFDVFHAAVERVLGRPVWTHEFASSFAEAPAGIIAEFEGRVGKPTIEEIMNLIPSQKRIIVVVAGIDVQSEGE